MSVQTAQSQLMTQHLLEPSASFVPFSKKDIEQTLVQRFEQQAILHADKIAVKTKYVSLTYGALNQAANRLAHALISRFGYAVEPCALLQQNGNPFCIITLLGILKAGKFYVPLDLSESQQKIASILAAAQIHILITDKESAFRAYEISATQVECSVLSSEELDDTLSPENLGLPLSPETPAYIFYTSGTTGRAKGVVDHHRNVLHNIMRYTNALYINTNDTLTLLQSCSFSGSVSNIFGALLNGATLCLFDLHTENVSALADWLEQEEVTIYHSVPAIFRSFPKEKRDFSSIRIIRLEGDQSSRHDVELYRQFFSSTCVLVNGLGATECGIVRQYFMGQDTELPASSVPLGYATADMNIVLIDDNGHVVDTGQVGEIVVESEYLAIGYWQDHERTSVAFREMEGSTRRYHSGDLGRFTSDRCLEYCGRKKFQAKLHGHLIDYGVVETALQQVEGITEAIVLIREDQPGEQRLVAYLVLASQTAPTITFLRHELAKTLPDYMLPSVYVFLDALPLNANKKVDRNALPAPSAMRPTLETRYIAPQTSLENALAEIWSDLLHIDRIGIHDNFFELGGNSLLASRFLAQLYQVYQVELPLRAVFKHPTIAQLAIMIVHSPKSMEGRSIQPLQRAGYPHAFPASFAQQRLWFLDQLQHGSPVYNISEAYSFRGDLNLALLEQSLNEIIKRHESLRTTFLMADDGHLLQWIAADFTVQIPLYDLQSLCTHECEDITKQLAVTEAQQPFDLAVGPLLRVGVVRQTQTTHVLLVTLHHIISDGWSMGILYQELVTLYDAYTKKMSSPLVRLPIQYADYAAWQQAWLQNGVLQTQLAYWKQQLANIPPALRLPLDKPRPSVETFRGAYESFELPTLLVEQLENIARQEGATLFMILLAVYQILLSYYSLQDDIVVGTDVANRRSVEVERLIGFFVNQLVLRTDLSGNPTFRELLQRVRNVVLDAYEHQDVPFDQLVKELNPVRTPDRSPFFQTKLVLQNIPAIPASLAVTIVPWRVDNGTAQLDLLLALHIVDAGLQGIWQYNTDLFETKTIVRMSQHFSALLQSVVTSQAYRLSQMKALLEVADMQQKHAQQRRLAQDRHHRLKNVQKKPVRFSEKQPL